MSLGLTGISVNAVCTELGIAGSTTRTWTELTSHTNINIWSFFAPGSLDVDANKNPTLTAPASNMKIGDFRYYNQNSNTPSLSPPSQLNYGPGSGSISVVIGYLIEEMNILEFATPAQVTSYKLYKSTTDRGNEANACQHTGGDSISITTLTYSTTSVPPGHTRDNDQIPGATQPTTSKDFNSTTNGFSSPNQTLYGDAFLGASITGARLINMGTSVSDGYFSFIAHEYDQPYINASGNTTPPSGEGYTASWIEVLTSSTACAEDANPDQTWNGTTFAFYVHMRGINGADERIIAVNDCNVYLTHDGGKQLVYSGSISHTSNQYISGTLQNSNTWSYDEVGVVTIEDVVWETATYTTC